MDQMTKFFLTVLLGSILIGACVMVFNPRYRKDIIVKSNAHYFPQADESRKALKEEPAP